MAEWSENQEANIPSRWEKAGASPPPGPTKKGDVLRTRPKHVRGDYPERAVRWYQVNSSDVRSIGVAQGASSILVGMGTFAMSHYFDLSKDIASLAGSAPHYLVSVANLALWAWVVFWALALVAFIWQGVEWSRIKSEHGIGPWWKKH